MTEADRPTTGRRRPLDQTAQGGQAVFSSRDPQPVTVSAPEMESRAQHAWQRWYPGPDGLGAEEQTEPLYVVGPHEREYFR
jgi:hypothetical protein